MIFLFEKSTKVYDDYFLHLLYLENNQIFVCIVVLQPEYVHDMENDKNILKLQEMQVYGAIFTHNDTRLVIMEILRTT